MSRKNLSRTVIEGGRSYSNHADRDRSHRDERATTRAWLDRVSVELEVADETVPRKRRHVYKDFHDKLGPTKRWLERRVGRPWDAVYAELCEKFDRRTLAGMHVVDAHIVGQVRRHSPFQLDGRDWIHHAYFVDLHGILRRSRPSQRYKPRRGKPKLIDILEQCRASLTYRGWWWIRVAGRGGHTQFWWERPLGKRELRWLARMPDALRAYVVIPSPFPSR